MTKEAVNRTNPAYEITHPSAFSVPDVVFRDYDIRGYAGTEITPEFAQRLGHSLASIFRQDNHYSVYVGCDCRLSSPLLLQALKNGLLSAGVNVVELGMVTTSILNYAVHHGDKASCGIMVTASHNPGDYNGFKIIVRGQVMAGETLQRIKSQMQKSKPYSGASGQQTSQQISADYLQKIVASCRVKPGFKIVVDAGNGAAGPSAVTLFEQLGCHLIPLYCEPDGAFPNHDPNPSREENLEKLIETVLSTQSDLGFAFDGDGDRLVVVSATGEILWPDRLMMIFAKDILGQNSNAKIVFDVKSSNRLDRLVRQHAGIPIMCKTGHAHVRQAVSESNALLGGEFSGHIFFNDRWDGFDDGLYAATRLLEILSSEHLAKHPAHLRLTNIIANFERSIYTPEILIPVPESEKFAVMEKLAKNCQFDGANIITIDGLRVEYTHGWGLIRASNTSANLTLRFEADSERESKRIKELFRAQLSPFIKNLDQYL